MRVLGAIVIILGLATLVFGIIFIPQANAGEQEIADTVAPLTLDEVSEKYDAVVVKYDQIKMAEEPAIQAGTAGPSSMYNYLGQQRALLGLAKASMGTTAFIRMMGIVSIFIGAGLIMTGVVLVRKTS
ncbi:MAG: hypothetical protein JW845_02190 [Dehalococcoidales bacterium]|nr:hypothetical protein [Dehalococcoidales bacterium]